MAMNYGLSPLLQAFRRGIQMGLSKYSFQTVSASDFWKTFQDSSDLKEVADSWAQQKGIPVITVRVKTLSTRFRFLCLWPLSVIAGQRAPQRNPTNTDFNSGQVSDDRQQERQQVESVVADSDQNHQSVQPIRALRTAGDECQRGRS